MKVTYKQNNEISPTEIEVDVISQEHTSSVDAIIDYLGDFNKDSLLLIQDHQRKVTVKINQSNIIFVEVQGDFVTFITKQRMYTERTRLYKVLEQLKQQRFIKIAKSTIINLEYLNHIDLENDGTKVAVMENQQRLIITRTYFHHFKRSLEIYANDN